MKFIFVTIKFCFIGILYFISERYSSKIISVAKIKFWFSCHVQHVSNTLRGKCHDNQNMSKYRHEETDHCRNRVVFKKVNLIYNEICLPELIRE